MGVEAILLHKRAIPEHLSVIARQIDKCTGATRTATWLICTTGAAYRAETWALVDVMISNEANGHPWIPSGVVIIAGVVFVAVSAGAGLVILAPAVLLAAPGGEPPPYVAETAP